MNDIGGGMYDAACWEEVGCNDEVDSGGCCWAELFKEFCKEIELGNEVFVLFMSNIGAKLAAFGGSWEVNDWLNIWLD